MPPRFTASMTRCMSGNAVIMSRGTSGQPALTRRSTSRPSITGMRKSHSTASTWPSICSSRLSAAGPDDAGTTSAGTADPR